MIRYYVMATGIVLAVGVIATAWVHPEFLRIRIAPTSLPASPRAADELGGGSGGDRPLTGNAPWALSALPDCVREQSSAKGPAAFVRSKLPAGATPIAPGTTVTFGPCTISVGDGEILVTRGSDRLRIPPHATLYRYGDELVLLRLSSEANELRVYQPAITR